MRPRTTAAVLAAGLTLLGGGTASAATGAAGSGIAADVQYQPENTGTVPVTPPPAETPAETPIATSAESAAPPETTTPPVVTTTTSSSTPAQEPQEHGDKATPKEPSQSPATAPAAAATPKATPVVESSSSLPFTGFDLVPVAIAGLALLALGAAMRRHGRRGQG